MITRRILVHEEVETKDLIDFFDDRNRKMEKAFEKAIQGIPTDENDFPIGKITFNVSWEGELENDESN